MRSRRRKRLSADATQCPGNSRKKAFNLQLFHLFPYMGQLSSPIHHYYLQINCVLSKWHSCVAFDPKSYLSCPPTIKQNIPFSVGVSGIPC